MKYVESRERSAELLRLALPHMSRHAAGLHPLSYAVWYEHVSGRNKALSKQIEVMTANGALLDEAAVQTLFDEHIAEQDTQATHRFVQDSCGVLDRMADSSAEAGAQTKDFGVSLSDLSQQVTAGAVPDAESLGAVLSSTHRLQASLAQLQEQIGESQRELADLRVQLEQAREDASLDCLTGLHNRRAFEQRLRACVADDTPACVLMVDIDHFKRVNDTYGHLFGDRVLQAVGATLKACVTHSHVVARIGGEEFAIVLSDHRAAEAHLVAEKIRRAIASSHIRRSGQSEPSESITVSLGLAERRADDTHATWFDRADQALYTSKRAGRNLTTMG